MNTNSSDKPLPKLSAVQARLIRKALDRTNDNVSKAARIIGVSRATMYRKVKILRSKVV